MSKIRHNTTRVERKIARIRGKLFGTPQRPRLTITRSQQHLWLQVVDDEQQITVVSASDVGKKTKLTGTKSERATQVAQDLLKKLQKAKIKKLVLDRGPYKYHGRIKAVAIVLREGGIEV
ncbi:MAG: 50S ribosomal protein L18 [Candidatus Pacebacteria bacterium GW2011_GWB1_47_8]|nr:MAG: 50S ribosomal protein L18 [Candidatus Pacebacteria bacterium GW2011_GWA1_46_10]KKU84135.1 MAG: 50S ribosomal protein L18 [Candidatus Pacebacteria bacterium GW2011_GWB1_47_8]HCR80908.1 50S ribosomal protein L18 [Candidatus Paceibacterota bacterium]